MNTANTDDTAVLTMVTNLVAEHGCELVDFDLEKRVIHIEGPEDAKVACALALQDLLD